MESIYIAPQHQLKDDEFAGANLFINEIYKDRYEVKRTEEPLYFMPHQDIAEAVSDIVVTKNQLESLRKIYVEAVQDDPEYSTKAIHLSEVIRSMDSLQDLGEQVFYNLVQVMIELKVDRNIDYIIEVSNVLIAKQKFLQDIPESERLNISDSVKEQSTSQHTNEVDLASSQEEEP